MNKEEGEAAALILTNNKK